MRHGVVQFPGDAQALLGDDPARLGGAFLLGQPEPGRGLGRQDLAAADQLARGDAEHEDHDLGQKLLEQRGESLPCAQPHHDQAGQHEPRGDADRPDQIAGQRRVVERHEEHRSGRDVPAGGDVVEEDQRRAGEHHLERPPVPEQDGHRQQRAEQVGPQVEWHRAGTAAGDDVDLGGRDDQYDDADVEQPDPERPLGHRPGRQAAARPIRPRHAPHGVTVCHSRPERNPARNAPKRNGRFWPSRQPTRRPSRLT